MYCSKNLDTFFLCRDYRSLQYTGIVHYIYINLAQESQLWLEYTNLFYCFLFFAIPILTSADCVSVADPDPDLDPQQFFV
jgi:hypothetical protein